MVLRLVGLAALLALAPTAIAQTQAVGKGSQADLRGATTVLIDPEVRADLREAIAIHIRAELPEITVVERSDDAALVIRFFTTIGSDSLKLDGDGKPRSQSPELTTLPAGPSPRARFPGENRPDIVDSARNSSRPIDVAGDDMPEPRNYRYATGSVLKPTGTGGFIEPFSFRRRIGSDTDRAVRDFVRKFAKSWRKANSTKS